VPLFPRVAEKSSNRLSGAALFAWVAGILSRRPLMPNKNLSGISTKVLDRFSLCGVSRFPRVAENSSNLLMKNLLWDKILAKVFFRVSSNSLSGAARFPRVAEKSSKRPSGAVLFPLAAEKSSKGLLGPLRL